MEIFHDSPHGGVLKEFFGGIFCSIRFENWGLCVVKKKKKKKKL